MATFVICFVHGSGLPYVSYLLPCALDLAMMCHRLCVSRSWFRPFRCPPVSACAFLSRSFSAPFCVPHRAYAKSDRICQTALALQIVCKFKSHPFLPMFWGLWLSRYSLASPSRFCNLVHELLPCFMISVCPVHAFYGPAPVEFNPIV